MKKGLSLRNFIRKLQQRRSLKIHWIIQCSGGKNRRRTPDLLRPVRPVHLGFLKKSRNNKKERPSFKQLLAKYKEKGATQKQKKRPDQVKDTNLSSERREQQLLMCNKVIMLLRHIHLVGRLLHGSGRILTSTHLWIIVECIYVHILFNIFLHIQVMVPL